MEQVLLDELGADRVVWLPRGLADDTTNGHVDNVVAFVGRDQVLMQTTTDVSDPDYATARENRARPRGRGHRGHRDRRAAPRALLRSAGRGALPQLLPRQRRRRHPARRRAGRQRDGRAHRRGLPWAQAGRRPRHRPRRTAAAACTASPARYRWEPHEPPGHADAHRRPSSVTTDDDARGAVALRRPRGGPGAGGHRGPHRRRRRRRRSPATRASRCRPTSGPRSSTAPPAALAERTRGVRPPHRRGGGQADQDGAGRGRAGPSTRSASRPRWPARSPARWSRSTPARPASASSASCCGCPIGVVAAISPFNFPLNLVAHKLAPAIAAGLPGRAQAGVGHARSRRCALAQMLVDECGLPDGWLNVVTCSGSVGQPPRRRTPTWP